VDAAVNLLQIRVAQIEQRPDTSAVVKVYPEPPFYSHIYFSGDITKTHRFCCLIRDTFA
jgi:hypothetical protein